MLRKGWDMSGSNAELIKKAREVAGDEREVAERFYEANPVDSNEWEMARLLDMLADALEAAEAAK